MYLAFMTWKGLARFQELLETLISTFYIILKRLIL